jgi:hypothetical protein
MMTEVMLAFFIAASFALLAARQRTGRLGRWAAGLGALGALCVLAKPNASALPLLWSGAAAGRSRTWRAGLIALLAAALVLSPWVLRNWIVFGRPMISSVFEVNVALLTAPITLATARGVPVSPFDDYTLELHVGILNEAESRYGFSFAGSRAWPPPLQDLHARQVAGIALEIIAAHPMEAITTHLAGSVNTWNAESFSYWYEWVTGQPWDGIGVSRTEAATREALASRGGRAAARELALGAIHVIVAGAFLLGWKLGFLFAAVTGVVGVLALRREPAFVATVLCTLVYGTLLPGPIGMERFAVPFVPCVAILSGIGAVHLARAVARRASQLSLPTLPRPLLAGRQGSAN